MSEWISVEDRLPKVGESVLVYGKWDDFDHEYYSVEWNNKSDGFGCKNYATITHWMPKPEPPEI